MKDTGIAAQYRAKGIPTVVVFFAVVLLTGCGGGSSSSAPQPSPDPTPEGRLQVASLNLADSTLKRCVVEQAAEQSWVYVDEIDGKPLVC